VIQAEDGKSALTLLASNPTRIDLVLTDVVIRGMSGPELVLRLLDSHSEAGFLYMVTPESWWGSRTR
jgi:response regulator RpfG family c-di-GMP phosphodiesterase